MLVPFVWLLVLVLGACGGDDGAQRTGSEFPQVVIADGADMDKPNPLVSESQLDNSVNAILYRPLLAPRWENGELRYRTSDEDPLALVRRVEYFGPDSASLRYHMRTDVLWTDGEPVTAQDAAFTLRIQGLDEVASPRQDYNREIAEIIAEDDSTLVVHFTRRYPDMFFHTAGAIIPRHVYEGTDLSQMRSHASVTDPVNNLVTNGPMKLTSWTRGQQVILDPNPDFLPTPQVRVVFRIIPEETTRMIELQTGNVDHVQVPFNFLDEIESDEDIRIELMEKRSYEYIAYNPEAKDYFADRDIRRALTMALDRESMIAALQLDEYAQLAGGPYSPIFSRLYDPEGQTPLPYDTAAARRIFEEKGWTRGTDGVLTKDGERFSFTMMTNGDNRRRVDIAQLAEQQWSRLGIETAIQTLEFNTSIERTQNREFEVYIGGWGVGISADLYQLWGNPDAPFNFVGYDNAEAQRLMGLAAEQPTEETAASYWRQVASIIVDDQPYTWLFFYDRPYAVRNRLQGVRIDTLDPYQEIWNWRVID